MCGSRNPLYHNALSGYGVTGYDRETCWRDYRLGMIQALLISALGFAFATSTGPRRAHKLTDEVLAYVRRLREQDGCGTPARLERRVSPHSEVGNRAISNWAISSL